MPSKEKSYPGALPRNTILNERYKILGTIGKEAFEGELYIVKVTKGALWHEEIVTLGKVLALETGDENGSSDRILSASEITKDADAGTGLAADLEDYHRDECLQNLDSMKQNGKKSAFLYFTDYSSKMPFVSCGVDDAADALRRGDNSSS